MTDEGKQKMNEKKNPKLKANAQHLRANMTKEERHLWYDFLKLLPVTVHRQKVIGNYIVDFYCAAAKLVIELDGSQHYETDGIESDFKRDAELSALGLTVVRYTNLEIKQNFTAVCEDIMRYITPHQPPAAAASRIMLHLPLAAHDSLTQGRSL